jgi:flagellar motor protein MotB
MKISMLFTLPLAAALVLPAVAQQTTTDNQQPSASSTQSSPASGQSSSQTTQTQTSTDTNSDQNMSAHQPLQPETREGFWGKINPFARKKYVQRQMTPIRDRVNELDDLTAENARQIKDVDARAQEGIRQADAKATMADQHAVDAGNRAQQANQTAMQASNRLNTVEQVVGNIDQYQPATQTEIRFRSGQTTLSKKDRDALDDMTANLKDQKGYIIEVQGFSTGAGQSGIQSSQAMANSVVRYLVEKNEIPVYRVFVMGMGNAKLPTTDESGSKRAHGNRVEISLMKNNVDQLASAQSSGEMGSSMGNQSTGYSTPPARNQSAPMQSQPNNMKSAPASNTPQQ